MGRNIVLCLDGTVDVYPAFNTNVMMLHAMLDRADDDQLTYYHPGIGTISTFINSAGESNKEFATGLIDIVREGLNPLALIRPVATIFARHAEKWFIERIDTAVGLLLKEHVIAGYRFLMNYYRDGDRIFIFGFSRGAYTARALAAMIYKVGLLSPGNNELVPIAWEMIREFRTPKVDDYFRHMFSRRVTVRFLGLWDTVSSIGWVWNPVHFRFMSNNPIVDVVRHAVALDERRAYYRPNLWTNHPEAHQDVQQVWFPGVHCDVGGGYSEAGLSKIALKWMVDQAEAFGLQFHPKMKDELLPISDTAEYASPSASAVMHQSLHGLWWIDEFMPKRFWSPASNHRSQWHLNLGRPRYLRDGSRIHVSVFERQKCIPSYRPQNIPKDFVLVP